jgi:hypothetical protein
MASNSKIYIHTLLGLLPLLILFSCNSSDNTAKNFEIVSDTTLDDFSYLELKIDTIDSTNHTKYLNKDGSYSANWNMLQDIKIEQIYFPKHNANGNYADFGISPMFLKDKNISIEGYMIPYVVDSSSKELRYFLSYYPNSACFFCGGNGPETIMELKLKAGHRNFRSDEYLKFKGKLILNNGNPFMLNYLLYDAKPVE